MHEEKQARAALTVVSRHSWPATIIYTAAMDGVAHVSRVTPLRLVARVRARAHHLGRASVVYRGGIDARGERCASSVFPSFPP